MSQTHLARQPNGTRQPLPIVAKQRHSRIPPPQAERIKARFIRGESQRAIARAEGRSRPTIARIVNSADMQNYVRELRSEIYRLGFDAMKSLRFALQNNQDPRLAYRLLVDIGVVPSPEELAQMRQAAHSGSGLTPFQKTMLGLGAIAERTSRIFGGDLPTEAEMVHNMKVSNEIDRMTNGNSLSLSNANPAEWGRLKRLAEDVLQGKRGPDDPEIVAVRHQYEAGSREPGPSAT